MGLVTWTGSISGHEHVTQKRHNEERRLRLDVEVQNVERQNVENYIENVELIWPILKEPRKG
jgi:hypothetical protein